MTGSFAAATGSFWEMLRDRFVIDLHIGDGFAAIVRFMQTHLRVVFDGVRDTISYVADSLMTFFNYVPAPLVVLVLVVLAAWRVGWRFAAFTFVALYIVLSMGLWSDTMDTLGLVTVATLTALLLGLPLGIAMAKSELLQAIVRPVLDFMQTLPAFVYLIPAVIFFGTGPVPGTIATVIFSMPPCVRLMNLGIRHVPTENVEAGRAFGCNPFQLLFKVELPLAMPSIMAGINQTIMLALSMVVIASMIGAGGLGDQVLLGINSVDVGVGFEGGLGVVILAIILDRLTQSFGQRNTRAAGLTTRLKQLFSRGGDGAPAG